MQLGNKEIFAQNLRKFIDISGKDRKEIAKTLGVPYSTFTEWANGRKYPRINNIEKLAEYFEVQKSDFIENDFKDIQKDNEDLVDLVVKIRKDDDLFRVVKLVADLNSQSLSELEHLLKLFHQKREN